MSFANPLALLWLAALIPVVVFYILKIRLRRVPISTMLFWRQIYDEHQPRSIWQRMRHWLSLLAQIVLILLLVGALTDPFFAWETRQLRRIVLVVDNSASMNATDVSPSRLSAAKDEALRVIREMRFRDELAVVTGGGSPRVVCGFSSHGRTLSHAVEDVVSTDNPTRVTEAVELGRRLLGERQDEHRREIVVLTDGSSGGSPETAAESKTGEPPVLRWHHFGTNAGNVGITRFQVRRSLIDPLGYEILAEVTNASDDPVECRLEIDLNDEVVDVVPLKLTPGQHWSQSFEKTSAEGGQLTAKLDRADVLAMDNLAWAVLPKREMMPVTLVSEGNLFLQKVFESNPLVTLTRIDPPGRTPAPNEATSGITVLHRHVPEVLPSGAVLVIDPRGSCDAWQLGEPVQNPIVHQQDKDSLLLGHVRLDNVVMPEARQVKFASDEGIKVLARSLAGDPLLAIIERPRQKVLLLTVNLDEGDLPLRTAFPILMMNALNWFTENRGELRESLPTGSITEIDVAAMRPVGQPGKADLRLVAPDGRRSVLPMQSERLSLGPFDQCGIWRVVEDSDTTLLELACNLADRNESDVRVPKTDEATTASVVSASLLGNRPLWFWLIAIAWLLMAIEWWAYQRRVIT
ncbi:MAG: VWA domain-containing protein [Planctomycetota bacterium]|nr:MAG: VWA domain-containing protein [Planctomycetota bacterium]GDY07659.1 hypothetical protein LBMAG52_11450 [Planctomycetia bacterium]